MAKEEDMAKIIIDDTAQGTKRLSVTGRIDGKPVAATILLTELEPLSPKKRKDAIAQALLEAAEAPPALELDLGLSNVMEV